MSICLAPKFSSRYAVSPASYTRRIGNSQGRRPSCLINAVIGKVKVGLIDMSDCGTYQAVAKNGGRVVLCLK